MVAQGVGETEGQKPREEGIWQWLVTRARVLADLKVLKGTRRITVSQAGQHGNDEHLECVDVLVATCKYGKLTGNSRKAKRN
jgi:hypothetical protein